MIVSEKYNLFVRISVLCVLTACLLLLAGRGEMAGSISEQKASVPSLAVQPQPDSPLRINILSYDSSDPRTPEITYEVINTSVKPVSAYTISQETVRGNEKSSGTLLSDLALSNVVLNPGQYFTESITYQPLSDKPSQVTLSVDFVEFNDGATWGPNLYKSNEMLAGQRAGAREARKQILTVYKAMGLQEALKHVEAHPTSDAPPPGFSPNWEDGFRHGYSFASTRLRGILNSGDMKKIEAELRRLSEK